MLSFMIRLYLTLSVMIRALSLAFSKCNTAFRRKSSQSISSHHGRPQTILSCAARDVTSDPSVGSADSQASQPLIIPRAAVSVVVRLEIPSKVRSDHLRDWDSSQRCNQSKVYYALIQRGKEPNKGIWSFPGGKTEAGESSINAAKRELWEETRLTEECNSTRLWSLRFFEDGPVTSTDSIIQRADSGIAFHYVITQWFAQIIIHDTTTLASTDTSLLFPNLIASDDAANAKWWSYDEIIQGISSGQITKGVEKVINRSELLYQKGLL